jgi:hypothetical protein
METKQLHALYALESHRPDTKQQAIIGMSAWSRVISVLRCFKVDCQVDLEALVDEAFDEGGFSVVGKEPLGSAAAAGGVFTIAVTDGGREA